METAIMDLIAIGGTLLGSLVLGITKKYTGVLDGAAGKLIKPVQPVVVLAAGLALPWLASKIGLVSGVPDASVFIAAPTATVITVALREALSRLGGKK
jgi:hypothetical protein